MARPRKSARERRTYSVNVRLSPDEYAALAGHAKRAGLPVTTAAREFITSGRLTVKRTRALDWQSFDQISRIGNNLNQIARQLNVEEHGHPPPEFVKLCQTIDRLLTDALADEV